VNRPKLKIAVALIVMFLFGALAGAGVNTFLHPYFFSTPQPEEIQKHLLSFWTRRLNLTPEQEEQAKSIAADFAQQVAIQHEQSIRQLSQLAEATDDRLSQYLTADQRRELDQVRKGRQKDFGQHGLPAGPP
jgi:hypothetical protein